jgi:hypothetical protein
MEVLTHPYLHTVVPEVCVLIFILPMFILISSLTILCLRSSSVEAAGRPRVAATVAVC